MSIDQAEKPRSHSGRFQKGHPGYKPKGATNKTTKSNREAMLEAAKQLGGKEGLVGYYKANPKLLNEGLIEILPSRSKAALVDAAGNAVDNLVPGMSCPGIDNFNVIGIPHDWVVVGLLDHETHMPRELLHKLRTVLPRDAFTPLRDPALPPPVDDVDDTPPDNVRPMLKVYDRADDGGEPAPDPETPPAA